MVKQMKTDNRWALSTKYGNVMYGYSRNRVHLDGKLKYKGLYYKVIAVLDLKAGKWQFDNKETHISQGSMTYVCAINAIKREIRKELNKNVKWHLASMEIELLELELKQGKKEVDEAIKFIMGYSVFVKDKAEKLIHFRKAYYGNNDWRSLGTVEYFVEKYSIK